MLHTTLRGEVTKMAEKNTSLQKTGNDLVKSLDNVFKQAPHLPENIREVIVQIAPWVALILGILGVFGSLSALLLVLGLSPLMALAGGMQSGVSAVLLVLVGLVQSVITLMAFPKLQKNQYSGWMLLFWSELIGVVAAVLSLSIVTILGIIIGFYLLFEVKSYYK